MPLRKTVIDGYLVGFVTPYATPNEDEYEREIWIIQINNLPTIQTGKPDWIGNISLIDVNTLGPTKALAKVIHENINLHKLWFIIKA